MKCNFCNREMKLQTFSKNYWTWFAYECSNCGVISYAKPNLKQVTPDLDSINKRKQQILKEALSFGILLDKKMLNDLSSSDFQFNSFAFLKLLSDRCQKAITKENSPKIERRSN